MNTKARIPITRRARAALRAAAAALLAAAVLAACNDGGNATDQGTTASATVGAAGGSLSSPDGSLALTIPAGALANDTPITITEVTADAVPEHLKAIGGDRVYRLGPVGTQFARPVTASVTLAAGNQLAVMLIDSDGATAYAGNQIVKIDAQGRRVLGELTHFSHLVARTVGSFTAELTVDRRELKVGEELRANARLSKTASDEDGVATCAWGPYGDPLWDGFEGVDHCNFDGAEWDFFRGLASSWPLAAAWRCNAPSDATKVAMEFEISGQVLRLPGLSAGDIRIRLETDVRCTEGEPSDQLATGVFPLAIGTQPDGIQVFTGEFNGKPGPWMWIAVREGVVLSNLVTGLTEVNLTNTGEGALGADNFDVGSITDGSVWGVMALGATGGALRSLDANGQWGATQLTQQGTYNAATFAGNPLAQEMAVAMDRGVGFVVKDPATGVYGFDPAKSIDFTLFPPPHRPISVTPTSTTANSPVIALIPGTDSGTTSTVVFHDRTTPTAPARVLLPIADPNGRRVRCHSLPDGRLICIVSAATLGKAWKFIFDLAQPAAPVAPEELPVGTGSVGVNMALGADGKVRAVVANLTNYNEIRIADDGSVIGNVSHALPSGITSTAHVVPFSHQGKDYVGGASKDDSAIFILLQM